MKKSLMLSALALLTVLGMSETAEAQWGRSRGFSISIGSARSGIVYSRGLGYRSPYVYGPPRVGYPRVVPYRTYSVPVYSAPRGYYGGYYGGGGFYGGRSYYGRGFCR